MHLWILIYVVSAGAHLATATVPQFTDRTACERAAVQLKQVMDKQDTVVSAVCVPSDGQQP